MGGSSLSRPFFARSLGDIIWFMFKQPTRRQVMGSLAAGMILGPGLGGIWKEEKQPRFKIGACDWSIGKRQQIEALELGKKLGLDGVQVSFDDRGTKTDLRAEEARRGYQEKAKETGVEIASLAMGCLNNIPY